MAMDNHQDQDLVVLNAGHIFPYSTTYIVFLRALYLRNYMYDFISEFSPHLNRSLIHQALSYENNQQVLTMFNGMKLNIK